MTTRELLADSESVTGTDNVRAAPAPLPTSSVEEALTCLNRELLWTEAKDVW